LSIDFTQGSGYSYTVFGGETQRYDEAIEAFRNELVRIREEGPDEAAFERIRRKMTGKFISASNSLQYLSSAFMHYYMKGHHLFDYLKTIHEIRVDEAFETFKQLYDHPAEVISIIKPRGEKTF
jgi:predicted Zn-dependent peptidase